LSGRVGFHAFNTRNGILAHTLAIGVAHDPQTVALLVPDIRSTSGIVITNESFFGGQVEILDAAILVAK
jgi:hypothetical protein